MRVSPEAEHHDQQARKIFSELREKLFDHNDSTNLCHSKTLTAMKR